MYTTSIGDGVREYNINEEDAYRIAIQVLQEMEHETFEQPELFKTHGFSSLYSLLIYKVCRTAERVYDVSGINKQ